MYLRCRCDSCARTAGVGAGVSAIPAKYLNIPAKFKFPELPYKKQTHPKRVCPFFMAEAPRVCTNTLLYYRQSFLRTAVSL